MMEGFGRRLENLREKAGYTKKDMSKELNFSANVYGEYERGKVKPSLDTVVRLATFFNVTLDYLVFGKVNEQEINKSLEKLIRIFQENGITDPCVFQLTEWSVLNKDDLKYLQKNFEWVVNQAKMRK